jgi:hypothetical protein
VLLQETIARDSTSLHVEGKTSQTVTLVLKHEELSWHKVWGRKGKQEAKASLSIMGFFKKGSLKLFARAGLEQRPS